MANNTKKNIALVIAMLFLFLALLDGWQYEFFTLLRFVVFATTAYVTWITYNSDKMEWTSFLGLIAILFNPFFPVYLNREMWILIDIATGLSLIATIIFLKLDSK